MIAVSSFNLAVFANAGQNDQRIEDLSPDELIDFDEIFTDEVFRGFAIDALRRYNRRRPIATKKGIMIPISCFDNVEEIDVRRLYTGRIGGSLARNLNGIKYFRNLEVLKCTANWIIETIDVSGLDKLRKLECDIDVRNGSNGYVINVSGCKNLEAAELYLAWWFFYMLL